MNAPNENTANRDRAVADDPTPVELKTFLQGIVERQPDKPEFHGAVREFMETVFPKIEGREELSRKNAVLERMVEPDRIFSFRVCGRTTSARPGKPRLPCAV